MLGLAWVGVRIRAQHLVGRRVDGGHPGSRRRNGLRRGNHRRPLLDGRLQESLLRCLCSVFEDIFLDLEVGDAALLFGDHSLGAQELLLERVHALLLGQQLALLLRQSSVCFPSSSVLLFKLLLPNLLVLGGQLILFILAVRQLLLQQRHPRLCCSSRSVPAYGLGSQRLQLCLSRVGDLSDFFCCLTCMNQVSFQVHLQTLRHVALGLEPWNIQNLALGAFQLLPYCR
mmetsp:Transcript_115264/g.264690  ORF Transcript_115264/g.264690 Transcript_115264/m.264690 type:complete len:229 (+) Transcript_115264:680-1366(+)